jgi:hypothetical protein
MVSNETHCTASEWWRTDQLEDLVKALTHPIVAPRRLRRFAPASPSNGQAVQTFA